MILILILFRMLNFQVRIRRQTLSFVVNPGNQGTQKDTFHTELISCGESLDCCKI